jgi:hypothetical protein
VVDIIAIKLPGRRQTSHQLNQWYSKDILEMTEQVCKISDDSVNRRVNRNVADTPDEAASCDQRTLS